MSGDLWIDRDYPVDIVEHQRIRNMCIELKKEKDMLKESLSHEQSINAELIRRFESNVTAASKLHKEDRKYIEELERELRNCTRKMGKDFQSASKRASSILGSDNKESELEGSALQLEKLQTHFSSMQLQFQFEIESMKLEMTSLEQRCHEAERYCEQDSQKNDHIDTLFRMQFPETQLIISSLEIENRELQQKLAVSERTIKTLFCKMKENLDEFLKEKTGPVLHSSGESFEDIPIHLREEVALLSGLFNYKDLVQSYFSRLAILTSWVENVKDEMLSLSDQFRQSECLVSQLKEELKGEQLKSKEEAEDLTQAMAELRYQITEMLEEERRHRAMIERVSLQRIKELEKEVHQEKMKSSKVIKNFHEAAGLAEARAVEIQQLRKASMESNVVTERAQQSFTDVERCCEHCVISRSLRYCDCNLLDVETSAIASSNDDDGQTTHRSRIDWYLDEDTTRK